jgi:ABC-type nickel/cobalt efflux system permease component RcnA
MTMRRRLLTFSAFFVFFVSFVVNSASAHPVGERTYDRTIAVRLTGEAVVVSYELEVNTASVMGDLAALGEEIDVRGFRSPNDYYKAFVTYHAPVLARNLDATLDDKPLTFACADSKFEVREQVSVHCQFVFRAPWRPAPDAKHKFTFKEGNYEQQSGRVRLSLAPAGRVAMVTVSAPSAELQAKPLTLLAPGEAEKLCEASATFTVAADREERAALKLGGAPGDLGQAESKPAPADGSAAGLKGGDGVEDRAAARDISTPQTPSVWGARSLEELLLHRDEGLWLLMAVAAFLGAAHALTPGHGKTLVAAYLVGERGTVGHALYLGLVTTLSHTGIVLAVALVVQLFFAGKAPPWLQTWLGLGGGLLVAGLGAWLLLARLAGRADHVHLFGGHHHHHGHGHGHGHGAADHYHDEQGDAHPVPGERVGWWRLTVLGVTGGIIPCHDAVALYLSLLSAGLLALALPLLLAFSAGLAGVLVAIGIVVVKAKGKVGARWGESRAFRALPVVSAALVTCVGLWLCYHSLP